MSAVNASQFFIFPSITNCARTARRKYVSSGKITGLGLKRSGLAEDYLYDLWQVTW